MTITSLLFIGCSKDRTCTCDTTTTQTGTYPYTSTSHDVRTIKGTVSQQDAEFICNSTSYSSGGNYTSNQTCTLN